MSKRKHPGSTSNLNGDFCDVLMELADYENNVKRKTLKYNAYRNAASVLAAHPKKIDSGDEAKKLSGIGEKIAKKFDIFLQTGKLPELEKIRQDKVAQAILLLTRVSGIGPVKAAELVSHGIKTIEDLKKHQNIHKLYHHQIIGLKYFDDFEKKIPRAEIQEIEIKFKDLMKKKYPEFTLTICGSYRRGKLECGDIDALVTHPSVKASKGKKKKHGDQLLKNLVAALDDLVIETISVGKTKFMGVCRLSPDLPARRLDIRLIQQEQYPYALLSLTGSDMFVKTMRMHAKKNGFILNEYSLRPRGVAATDVPGEPISSEEEIFEHIKFPYKKPEERNM